MIERLIQLALYRQAITLLMIFAITLFFVNGLTRLQIDTSLDSLIPANDPTRLVYDKVATEFGTDNRTIVYVKDDKLWTPAKLGELERLHNALSKLDYVTRVDSVINLHTISGIPGVIDARPLIRELPDTEQAAQQLRRDALKNPLFRHHFLSAKGDVTALLVSIREDRKDGTFNHRVNKDLENLLDVSRPHFQQLLQVGAPRINAEIKTSLIEDFTYLGPLSALVLIFTMMVFLRSTLAAAIPLLTSAISIVWTFGFMGWTGMGVNILSVMLPSLIIVIGSTEDTHLFTAYMHERQRDTESSQRQITHRMLRKLFLPLLLTVLTTALGFASNTLSDISLIRDFSITASLAILFNGLVTILLVPMLLSRYAPTASKLYKANDSLRGLPGLIYSTFHISQKHFPRVLLIFTAILCGGFIHLAAKLYVTNDPLSYFQEDRELIQHTRQIHEDLAGIKLFFVTLKSDRDKAFLDPDNLNKVAAIQDFMQRQGGFDATISLADHLKFINQQFRQTPDAHTLPRTRQLVAQYLMFLHRSDIRSYVSHDYRRANIVVRHNISDSSQLNSYINELKEALPELVGNDLDVHIVGENLMINTAAEGLIAAQVQSLSLLLLVIFIIMSIMFTSLKGGMIAVVPAIIPIVLMFGVMGLFDIPLNPGTAMVAVIAIGIAIDGTIHLLSHYNERCRHTSDYVGAVRKTVEEEATPLVASSLALAAGFAILLFSNFTIIAQFGALAAATMLFSIFSNLLVTPVIMTYIRLIGLHQILSMNINQEVFDNSPLFADMSNYQRRKAILISEMHDFDDGTAIIKQGSEERSMYLLLEGEVAVKLRTEDGTQQLATLKPGQIFGEIGFIKKTLRTADVVATGKVSVLRFDYEKLKTDLKFFPGIIAKLNFNISCILGERLADVVAGMAKK